MKKVFLVTALLLLAGLNSLLAQYLQINPIPSYNVPVGENYTGFQEPKKHVILPLREKRDMDVEINSSSTNPLLVFATVWAVKGNGIQILGPYTVYPGEPLSIPIDNSQWGVVIESDFNITASVWIE